MMLEASSDSVRRTDCKWSDRAASMAGMKRSSTSMAEARRPRTPVE